MSAPAPSLSFEAKLDLGAGDGFVRPTSWCVTHGLGKPAAGTFTEVAITDEALGALVHTTPDEAHRVLEQLVREVAVQLYGTAWAFHYPPEQYESAIGRHGMRRRERVVVTSLEVYR